MNNNTKVGRLQVGAYGVGNFACQLSFTMVNMYLSYFYTDVFGLTPAAVAFLLLVAKVWDGINDPMMGVLMDKSYNKVGGYRTYIVLGTVLLVIFTILTFTVPGFGGTGKLVYAYVTYIGLGMSYTVMNGQPEEAESDVRVLDVGRSSWFYGSWNVYPSAGADAWKRSSGGRIPEDSDCLCDSGAYTDPDYGQDL